MKYTLVNKAEYIALHEEVARLRKLVDGLCVKVAMPEPEDHKEQGMWYAAQQGIGMRAIRHFNTVKVKHELRELESQRQILLEDYPNLLDTL